MSIDNEVDRDTHDHDLTYENEQSTDLSPMVRVSLKEKIQVEATRLNMLKMRKCGVLPI